MRTKKLLGILLLFLGTLSLISCGEDDKEGKKVIGYKEYILTVASAKVPGVVISCGNTNLMDVYAVMKEQSTKWEPLGSIGGFEYEPGYEYRIRIGETSYLDDRMGEPAWTEYNLLEVISKEEKASEHLPQSFIPDGYDK